MKNTNINDRIGDGSTVLRATRRTVLDREQSVKMPGVKSVADSWLSHEELLIDLYLFLKVSFGWDNNPLGLLREYFPEFNWGCVPCKRISGRMGSFIDNYDDVWILEGGVITATRKMFVRKNFCHFVSEKEIPQMPTEQYSFRRESEYGHELLGTLYMTTWERKAP